MFGFFGKNNKIQQFNDSSNGSFEYIDYSSGPIDNIGRSVVDRHTIQRRILDNYTLKNIARTGIGWKIANTKSRYSLNDTIFFNNDNDKEYYQENIETHLKYAVQYMVSYGRGILVIQEENIELSEPLSKNVNKDKVRIMSFAGVDVTPQGVEHNIADKYFAKPKFYRVSTEVIHHSRVIDFTYHKPLLSEIGYYNYGGISEFEFIYKELIADDLVSRGSAQAVYKNNSVVYKTKGLHDQNQSGVLATLKRFMSAESKRDFLGGVVLDKEDEAQILTNMLTGVADIDNQTLRRVALVTSIPMAYFMGENPGGLNNTGKIEQQVFDDMISNFQSDFLSPKMIVLFDIFGFGRFKWKEDFNLSLEQKIEREKVIITNASMLSGLGYDVDSYLKEKGVKTESSSDDLSTYFEDVESED